MPCSGTRPDRRSSSSWPAGLVPWASWPNCYRLAGPPSPIICRVLTEGGLAVSHANGTRRIYQLNPEGVSLLKAYLDRIWQEALLAFDGSAEGPSTGFKAG